MTRKRHEVLVGTTAERWATRVEKWRGAAT
jgi:hypothetical protein